jgi:peptidoglycan/xylan/chitin deacetylase (PgdA/CDA1 family)
VLGILPPRCHRPRDAANPKNPAGPVPDWYTGRVSHQTRQLLREDGGFLYDSDAYNDDLPYWLFEGTPGEVPHLAVPYALVNNDARYLLPNGFATGDDFGSHLRDAFDLLWEEGAQAPKLMSFGLHARISGHPARAMALARFLDHVRNRERIWVCRREDVARHWLSVHPAPGVS